MLPSSPGGGDVVWEAGDEISQILCRRRLPMGDTPSDDAARAMRDTLDILHNAVIDLV